MQSPPFGMETVLLLFNRKSSQQDTATRHLFCLSHEHGSMGENMSMYRETIKQHPPPPRSVHGGRKDVDVRGERPESEREKTSLCMTTPYVF